MPESDAVPNERFRDARIRLFGTRQVLAEAVNMVPTSIVVSENDIGKLKRGEVTWPREPRRSGFPGTTRPARITSASTPSTRTYACCRYRNGGSWQPS
ncbi:hypothetical protein FHR83_005447 [Actinoplanes campanulatus]|uniref:Uncharacterized protein n=1 Tax=Actinoplanes campanulatus TaxID=113559 RepID=A0A7W5FGM2_9ACTN|nr:hypothetical protein [Actinoplanes campanulatus]MBB3097763.1 hypothetical protein [Actinoplanes campanulatus]GGN38206.1 hypothetical protein GCM10010109_64870 [Actinoplanes campanulatus]GID39667.1 hypothetical protein Aca09nite_61730 [Actinoplanes campanulatus]